MSLPFDATLKDIVASRPHDFEVALDLPSGPPVAVLNVDLSTLSAATDVTLGYGDPLERIIDLNFQSGFTENLSRRVLLYAAALHFRYSVPVHSQVVLLRPAADHADVTGQIAFAAMQGRGKLDFSFEVVRLWQRPVERMMKGGLGTLPLAPLCRMPTGISLEDALKQVIREVDERLRAEASPADAAKLLTATFVLTGLRVRREEMEPLFRGAGVMRESSGYQIILDEGRVDHAKKTILRVGTKRFGPPDSATQQLLTSMQDLDCLDRMYDRLAEKPESVSDWQDLIATQ